MNSFYASKFEVNSFCYSKFDEVKSFYDSKFGEVPHFLTQSSVRCAFFSLKVYQDASFMTPSSTSRTLLKVWRAVLILRLKGSSNLTLSMTKLW